MKTIAIMQPYIFPYLGYYQLVNEVDEFVFFDDVNFIKKGWINRNQILTPSGPVMFTIPLLEASQNRRICDIGVAPSRDWWNKLEKTLEMSYKKAPFFAVIFPMLQEIFTKEYNNIGAMAASSVVRVFEYLGLPKKFLTSSELEYNREGNGQDKILSICTILKATDYINPANGRELYQSNSFNEKGLKLHFLNKLPVNYVQTNSPTFNDNLSMVDILMNNSVEEIINLLELRGIENA